MSRSPGITVALAQMAPRLGALDENLARHHVLIGAGPRGGADLVVFPELGLTGYLLQDLNAEVAMRRDDPRLLELAQAADGLAAVVSFVEESDDHRLFIAAALLEAGAVRHVHRKVFLPTYGLFDERRFFAPGVTSARRDLGAPRPAPGHQRLRGLLAPGHAAAAGARRRPGARQRLLVAGPRRGRRQRGRPRHGDLVADAEPHLRAADDELRRLRQSRRRGRVDHLLGRQRGRLAHRPDGLLRRPPTTRASTWRGIDPADVRRERIATPLLRDERPEVVLRQLDDIVRDRQRALGRAAGDA